MRSLFVYSLFLLFFISCRKEVGQLNRGEYPHHIGKILVNNCAVSGCHDSRSHSAAASLNLESWNAMFGGSNSGSPVIPYSSRFSSLCYYINTYPELGVQNVPVMPLNRPPLPKEEVKSIMDWIDAGAPDINGQIKWSDPELKKLYAVNQRCDVVTVFDSRTQLPMRFIEVGRPGISDVPHQVRVSPDGKFWYVIFVNHNLMEKYRCSDDKLVAQIPMTPLAAGTGTDNALNWNTFVISKDGTRAYSVSWSATGRVVSLDLQNHRLIKSLVIPNNPHAVALSGDETKIYVATQSGNYVTELDTAFTSSNEVSLDGNGINYNPSLDPHDMVLSPSGNVLAITCQGSHDLRFLNLSNNSFSVVSLGAGSYPQEVIYSSFDSKYYVSCMLDVSLGGYGTVAKIDPQSLSVQKIRCGYQPHGICADNSTNLLYVLSRNEQSGGPPPHHSSQCTGRNGFVNFIDLKNFALKAKKYELSVDPYFIAARP